MGIEREGGKNQKRKEGTKLNPEKKTNLVLPFFAPPPSDAWIWLTD